MLRMTADPEHLRARLRRIAEMEKLSVAKWARLAGLRDSTVRAIFEGRSRNPQHATLKSLADAVGMSYDQLVEDASRESEPGEWTELRDAREKAGVSQDTLAKVLGCDADMIRGLESGARLRSLEWADRIAPILGVTPERLLLNEDPPETKILGQAPDPQDWPTDLPVLGAAAAANGAMRIDVGRAIDHIRRPVGLAGAPNAYALYLTNDTMEPRHKEGDPILVHPDRPPRVGDDVIVQIRNEHGGADSFLKSLVRKSDDQIVLRQFNPSNEITVSTKDVVLMHRVSPWRELLGF